MSRIIELSIYRDEKEYGTNVPVAVRSYFTLSALFEDLKFLTSWSTGTIYVAKFKEFEQQNSSVNGN